MCGLVKELYVVKESRSRDQENVCSFVQSIRSVNLYVIEKLCVVKNLCVVKWEVV